MQDLSQRADLPGMEPNLEASPTFQDRGPLSLGQEAMWFLNQLSGADQAYIVPSTFRVEAGLDLDRFEAALRALVQRHAALRTLFVNTDEGPVQCVLEPASAASRFQLLRVAGPGSQPDDPTLARQIAELVGQPFRVDRELPFRVCCIELGDGASIVALRVHHLVSDGLSMGILHRELASIYGADGDASGLPPTEATLLGTARSQRAVAASDAWESQRRYWREELAGVEDLQLVTDHPRAAKSDFQAGCVRVEIGAGPVEALRGLARAAGTSRFRAWLALLQVLLARMASQTDFAVGIPVGGRKDPALRDTVGMFINTLAIRLPQGFDAMGFDALLRAVDAKVLAAIEHSDCPFEKIVADIATDRSLERNPVYQAYFSFENLPDRWKLALPGLEVSALMLPRLHISLDLSLSIEEHAQGGATATWQYRTDLFDQASVERMARRFDVLLRSVVAAPAAPIGDLAWFDAAERELVLSTWNVNEVDYRVDGGVASWLRARADAVPDATALVFGDASMSYRELDRLSEHWAVRLRAAGVGPEVIVGLGMRRSFGLVVGLLAIVKAGGAFMPLDPDYPAQRLRQMLEDAEAPVLLSDAGSAEMFAGLAPSAQVLVVEADGGPVPQGPVERLADEAGPEALAYVIFTSGSTGRPKGAMNLQRGLANDLLWYHRVLGFRPEDRVLQLTSISFDASIWQILATLAFGAMVVLPPPGLERDVDALALDIGRHGITLLYLVPSQLRALLAASGFQAPVPLRYVLCGGEALESELAGQFLQAFPGVRLGNFYGPSEASCDSACQEVELPLEPRAIVPIGRPTANVKLYVLDEGGRPLPSGVAGELFVGGVGVGRGYLKRPELTAERFVSDPWSEGGRLYRTGDRVRWLADGRLEFLGRLDTQVKLRGQRVELGEIEAALHACAGVREAAVVTHGQAQALALVAYVVAPGVGTEALRDELSARLPAYMVPAAFVMLDALPRLPNGKLDRRALPQPSFEARELDASAPRNGVEATLLEIWRGVLTKAKTIGTRSNFFELGGDSLSATLVVSRVRSMFGEDLPLARIFEHPTIAGLAEVLDGSRPQPSTEAMARVDRGGPLQVSFSQRRMWLIHQLDPRGAAYNMVTSRSLRGALDVDCLRRALTELVARHEAFRTRFAFGNAEPMAWIDAPTEARLTLFDAASDPAWPEQLQRAIAEPFDLERGPLHRFLLARLGDEEHAFVLVMHHIVLDDWARAILWRELAELYRAQRVGEAARLPAKRYDFADYAAWQRGRLDDAALQAQARRWIERLRGMVPLELPTDRKRGMRETSAGSTLRAEVGEAWVKRVRRFSAGHGVTPFMTLLAAFQLLLARWCGQDDIAVGFPVANRNHEYTEDVVGSLVNTLVMRVAVDPDATVAELLREVRAAALAAFENQDLPYDYLMDRLRAQGIVEAGADLRVLFNVLNTPESEVRFDGLGTTPYRIRGRATQFDLSLHVATEVAPTVVFAYSTELFSEGMVDAMLQAYLQLVEQLIEHPDAALRTLATTTPSDLERLRQWNATARELPAARTVHGLLQEHRGDATPAVRDAQGRELSHAQLWARVEQLSRMLRARGARRGRLVGLGVERGVDMVVAQLAVLRSGAAYLPLEPAFPRQRLQDMIEDAQPILLVTTQASQATWDGMPVPLLLLDVERAALDALSAEPEEPDAERDARGEDAAYVIYTSGSTGRPKGVVVPHAAVVNFLSSMRREPGLGASDRILAVTTLSFDIAVLELLLPLAVGGCAVIATREDAMDADRLRGLLEAQKITVMQATPGTWSMLVDSGWSGAPGFRALVGGESLSPELATALLGRCGEVWNMYGPTETTVWSTCWRVVPGAPVISIGRPIDNTQVYVLDAQGKPCAVGVAGEIWIGGAGVASGYFARPELTAERFVSDPWSEGGRMYRTGDRGRWLPDGLLEHRGRLDFQVKVRGYRIELGEIESRLLTHPRVRDCVVIVREDVPGDVRLVAYGVGEVPADELREHLRMTLPAYMVPQHFVSLDALPRLPNGKLDRRALPVPRDEAPARSAAAQDLNTPAERLMAAIWSELLGTPDVRRSDNFFDLGGHSLLANRAVVEFAARGGRRIELRRLIFESLGQLVVGVELGAQLAGDAHAAVGEPTPEAPARGPAAWLRRLLGR